MNIIFMILEVIVTLLIIYTTIIDIKYGLIKKMMNKIFHYIDFMMLSECNKNEDGLYIAEMFSRYIDKKNPIGYSIEIANLVLISKYIKISSSTTIISRLYFITKPTMLELVKSNKDLKEAELVNSNLIYIDYDIHENTGVLYVGRTNVNDLWFIPFAFTVQRLYPFFKRIYKRCKMKGKYIGIMLVDYFSYNDLLYNHIKELVKQKAESVNIKENYND